MFVRLFVTAWPRALVASGLVLVGALASPVIGRAIGSGAAAATMQTRSASCAGLDFYPARSDQQYSNNGSLRIASTQSGGSAGVFRCDPGLPNGAIITKVQFTTQDGSNRGSPAVSGCQLMRSPLAASTAANYDVMASVPSSTPGAGIQRLSTATITHPTVSNGAYGYWLECLIDWPFSNDGIYGADVVYSISAANG